MNQNDIIKQLMNKTPTKEEKARKELALKNAHPIVRDAFTSHNLQKAVNIMNKAQITSDMARNTLVGIMVRSSSSLPEISSLAKQIQDATKNILAGKNIVEYSMCHMGETKETLIKIFQSELITNAAFRKKASEYVETLETYQTAFILAELIGKMEIMIDTLFVGRRTNSN